MPLLVTFYLNLIRILGAFFVYMSHVYLLSGKLGWQLSVFGHEAVVAFFVLSGLIISYIIPGTSFQKYTLDRFVRIFSVTIPALFLAFVVYLVYNYYSVPIPPQAFLHPGTNPVQFNFVSGIFIVNEFWQSISVPFLVPLWSLSYEVAFYIFFGLLMFLKPSYNFLSIIFLVIAGPYIALYLPIWLFGNLVLRSANLRIGKLTSIIVFVSSIIGFGLLTSNVVYLSFVDVFDLQHKRLSYNLDPTRDYAFAIFFSFNLASVFWLSKFYSVRKSILNLSTYLANFTLSVYLYHMPLVYLFVLFIPFKNYPTLNLISLYLVVPFIMMFLSTITEQKRYKLKRIFLK